jgi:hypothetical protein
MPDTTPALDSVWVSVNPGAPAPGPVGPIRDEPTPLQFDRIPWGYVAIIAGVGWLVFAGSRRALRVQKRAAWTLAVLNDPLAVGPLAECLRIDDGQIRRLTQDALIRLLPQLRASHAASLNDEQHRCLNHTLGGKNAEMSLAILSAYEQVGDGRDIAAVQRLAMSVRRKPRDLAIGQAAEQCLAYLLLRAETQRAAQTYLRAACASDSPELALLRPSRPADKQDLEFLLRPLREDS